MPKTSLRTKLLNKKNYRSLIHIRQSPSKFNILTFCECKNKSTTKKAMGLFCLEIEDMIFSFYLNGHKISCFVRFPINNRIFPFPLTGVLAYEPNIPKLVRAMKLQIRKYGINYPFRGNIIQSRCFRYFSLLFISEDFYGSSDDSELLCNKCS